MWTLQIAMPFFVIMIILSVTITMVGALNEQVLNKVSGLPMMIQVKLACVPSVDSDDSKVPDCFFFELAISCSFVF